MGRKDYGMDSVGIEARRAKAHRAECPELWASSWSTYLTKQAGAPASYPIQISTP